MLSGTGVCLGGRSLCSRVKPVTVRMFYYISDLEASLGDEEGEQGLFFCTLCGSNSPPMTRRSSKVEDRSSELHQVLL